MQFFPYGETELRHLTQADPIMGEAIARLGMLQREVLPDPFQALVSSIIAQQISSRAAQTVEERVRALVPDCSATALAACSHDDLQRCGMSHKKVEYIHGIAHAVLNGSVQFDALHALPDEEVIRILDALPGVGRWTVEMPLIFSLCRPDVVSFDDLGIRRGMMRLYGLETLTRAQFQSFRSRYAPYGTVASLYLWAMN